MESPFKIYPDHLKEGQIEKIEASIAPAFLDIHEEELSFPDQVKISGEAYVAEEHLIIHLKVETVALMPCAICNQTIRVPVALTNFYHAQPMEEIESASFDFSEILREALVLEVPQFVECNSGKCPGRGKLQTKKVSEEHFFPFSDL